MRGHGILSITKLSAPLEHVPNLCPLDLGSGPLRLTLNFTGKPQNSNFGPAAPSLTQQSPNTIHGGMGLTDSSGHVCEACPRSGWTHRLGGYVLVSLEPHLWVQPSPSPPCPPNTKTEAGGGVSRDLGLRIPATGRTHAHLRVGLPGPWLCSDQGSRDPQPWSGRSAPAAWPAGPHQCQLLTLVASARSSTIQRGSPSPHLAIGSPVAPPPGPEQPQPQPQDRLVPAARQRLETTRSGRRTSCLAFPSTPRPSPP